MRRWVKLFLTILLPMFVHPQSGERDSLLAIINNQNGDENEIKALAYLAQMQTNTDSAIHYAKRGLRLAEKISSIKGKADCYLILSVKVSSPPDFAQNIQYGLSALDAYEQINDQTGIVEAYGSLQANFREIRDYKNALAYALSGARIAEANQIRGVFVFPGHREVPLFYAEIAQTYLLMNQIDSASFYTQKSIELKELFNNSEWNFPVHLLATIQTIHGEYQAALNNFRRAVPLAIKNGFFRDTLQIFTGMSTLFIRTGQFDSAIHYAKIVTMSKDPELETRNLLDAVSNLAGSYKAVGNKDSAIKYIELDYSLRESVMSNEKNREIQNITFNEELKEKESAAAQLKYRNKVQLYSLVGGIIVLLLIAGLLWRNNRQKQKAKDKVEKAYSELKLTQQQLVQSEKMASLGELTAGIAHEIQNPLNFVNNFSEVNKELIDELKGELATGNRQHAFEIVDDIKANEEKIIHHGKRADAIVKNMLQHSRSSSGAKEPTDINALADEYLRLAYHGHRAKDKSFNVTVKTDFDPGIGKVNIIAQDIGRVTLNLINNAFYAVDEKKKQMAPSLKGKKEDASLIYEPVLTVTTKRLSPPLGDRGKIEIRVADNGNGIPQKVLDKIFQPFFTTKPAGQGTGLGLSLAYDIVKAHGGELKVQTKEGEGSEFIIQLPIN